MDVRVGTIKKAECRRTDAFDLWYWRRLLSPLDCKEIEPVNPKGNQPWIFIGRTDTEAGAPILWPPDAKRWFTGKRPWFWETLRAGGEGDDRGWDGWMASATQWTWVWANSRRWWRTGKCGVLQSMGSERVGHSEWQLFNEETRLSLYSPRDGSYSQVLWTRMKGRQTSFTVGFSRNTNTLMCCAW